MFTVPPLTQTLVPFYASDIQIDVHFLADCSVICQGFACLGSVVVRRISVKKINCNIALRSMLNY